MIQAGDVLLMKVRELIERLKTLDQERGIWILYDGGNYDDHAYSNGLFPPIPDDIAKKPLEEYCIERGFDEEDIVREGDYIINAD